MTRKRKLQLIQQSELNRYGISELNAETRLKDDSKSFIKATTATSSKICFDMNRGGSDLLYSEMNKDIADYNHLNKVDLKRLKLDYGDSRAYPKLSERISLPRILDVKMSRNHTIVLTCEPRGNIFVSGSGNRGRLGLGHSQLQAAYTPIKAFKDDKVMFADLSDDHSIVLTNTGRVYTWGSNNYGQLGYPVEIESDKLEPIMNVPKLVNTGDLKRKVGGRRIIGVSCSKFHSLVYTKNELFLWGLNIGQFGFTTSKSAASSSTTNSAIIQATPKQIPFNYGLVKQVCATDSATLILSDSDEIHIYLNGFHVKVVAPLSTKLTDKHFNAFKPLAISKKKNIVRLITQKNSHLCLILLDNGDILQFNMDNQSKNSAEFQKSLKFSTLWRASKDHLKCIDVDMSNDGGIIISVRDGSAYKRTKRSTMKINSSKYKFSKINKLNKVVKVISDPLFSKFVFIRDDVDLVPHRLAKSRILEDIARLSPLVEKNERHWQAQVIVGMENVRTVRREETFRTDFVYRLEDRVDLDELDDRDFFGGKIDNDDIDPQEANNDNVTESMTKDTLYQKQKTRWTKSCKVRDSVLKPSEITTLDIRELLKSEDLEYWLTLKDLQQGKFYDYEITVKDSVAGTVFEFGVHKDILALRCEPLNKLIIDSPVGTKIEKDDVTIETTSDSQLEICGNITLRAVLIAVHFIYTDSYMDVWTDWPLTKVPVEVHRTKTSFDVLSRCLKMVNPMGRVVCKFELLEDLERLMNIVKDRPEDVTTVTLKDGETIGIYLPVLAARNAYFETLFSKRWQRQEESGISFPHISIAVFKVLLRYLYGVNYINLFDEVDEIQDISSLINFCLELMEVADQLMMDELSDICQLYIKDFIRLENVDILLLHAHNSKASKLFENCLWYIFNNLDYLLFDSNFGELINECLEDPELMKRISNGLKWFNGLKYVDYEKMSTSTFSGRESIDLTKQFVQGMDSFNSNFLHPLLWDTVLPLYDDDSRDHNMQNPSSSEQQTKISTLERRRRSSARRIREIKLTVPGAVELNTSDSLSSIQQPVSLSKLLSSNRSADSSGESAIDDDDTTSGVEEFTIVKSKRKSSSRRLSDSPSSSNLLSQPGSSNMQSKRQISPPVAVSQRQSTIGSSDRQSNLSPAPQPWAVSTPTPKFITESPPLSSVIGSSSSSSSSSYQQHMLTPVEQQEVEPQVIIKATTTSMPRLSQRERKKQLKEQQDQKTKSGHTTPTEPIAPWARPTDTPVWGTPTPASNKLHSLPMLGSSSTSQKSLSSSPAPLAPSFESILLEEQLSQSRRQQAVAIKSLEEVQQEEEFAQWWAEESARVQRELQASEDRSKNSQNNKKVNKKRPNFRKNVFNGDYIQQQGNQQQQPKKNAGVDGGNNRRRSSNNIGKNNGQGSSNDNKPDGSRNGSLNGQEQSTTGLRNGSTGNSKKKDCRRKPSPSGDQRVNVTA